MRRRLLISLIGLSVSLPFAQDVNFQGNSSNTVILQGEYTGSSANRIGVKGKALASGGTGARGEGGYIGTAGAGGEIGVDGTATGTSGVGYGVRGTANNASYLNYGVHGTAQKSGAAVNTGVYGYAWGASVNHAGYFDGNATVTGTFTNPSDAMFKSDVRSIEGALGKVMALKPRSYVMKTDQFKDRIALARGRQYGLVAQEAELVMPEIVHASKSITRDDKGQALDYKSVDYIALVPLLLKAIQEQQAEIESLKARLGAR